MSDLINRQDAIDAMNEVYCHIEMIKKRPVNKTEQAIYLDMIGAVKSVPSAERWIPCSERLPEGSQNVLMSRYGEVWIDFVDPVEDAWLKEHESVAWMPMPEPWKGE